MVNKKQTKKSRLNFGSSKLVRALNFSTTKGKFLIFILTFAIIGGGYMVYSSFAAAYPPSNFREEKIPTAKGTDGVQTDTRCRGVYAATIFGNVAYCMQIKTVSGGYQARGGYYSPVAKTFSPATDWMNFTASGQFPTNYVVSELYTAMKNGNPWQCRNLDNYFVPAYPQAVNTYFGPMVYGQIFRYSAGKWQIRWAHVSYSNGHCFPSGDWANAVDWK